MGRCREKRRRSWHAALSFMFWASVIPYILLILVIVPAMFKSQPRSLAARP
jgi:hypothetical protein